MTCINLLPPGVIHKQQMRKLVIRLAITQVSIWFIFGLFFMWLTFYSTQLEQQTNLLTQELEDDRFTESDRIAELLKESNIQKYTQVSMYEAVNPSKFNMLWLHTIIVSLPYRAEQVEIKMENGRIFISCLVYEWEQAETYRDTLLDTGLFTWVRYGGFTRQDDGRIRYELQAVVE